MEWLYRYLLGLLPPSFRQPFEAPDTQPLDEEMYAVYVAAAADARARGRWPYAFFCLKEVATLLGEVFSQRTFLPRRLMWLPGGAALGLVAGLLTVMAIGQEMYTSTATLYWRAPLLLRKAVAVPRPAAEEVLARATGEGMYGYLVESLDLYPKARASTPVHVLAQRVREDLRIDGMVIRFRYAERYKAQAVAQAVASQILQTQQEMAFSALSERVGVAQEEKAAAKERWLRGLHEQAGQRVVNDARAHYEASAREHGRVLLMERALRVDGAGLQLLNAASLPVSPDTPHRTILLYGALFGTLAGAAIALFAPNVNRTAAIVGGERK